MQRNMLRHLAEWLLCIGSFVAIGCSDPLPMPHDRSSAGLTMDGTHALPISGGPDIVERSQMLDSITFHDGFSTAPVPINTPFAYVVGTRSGAIVYFDRKDSVARVLPLAEHSPIDQLLVRGDTVMAISVAGTVTLIDGFGKQVWSHSIGQPLTVPAVLANSRIVLISGHRVTAIPINGVVNSWSIDLTSAPSALAYSSEALYIAAANDVCDSVFVLTPDGGSVTSFGFPGIRITSNLTLIDSTDLIFGGLRANAADRRTPIVIEYQREGTSLHEKWHHELPYLVTSVSANRRTVVAAGFRTLESEIVSGVAAFVIDDTTTLWQRRFSQPIVAPVGISESSVYFTISFETEAPLSSRGLLETLDAATGKTISERAARGAATGFVPAIPMPDDAGRLLVSDRTKPVVHLFDRSGLKRMF